MYYRLSCNECSHYFALLWMDASVLGGQKGKRDVIRDTLFGKFFYKFNTNLELMQG